MMCWVMEIYLHFAKDIKNKQLHLCWSRARGPTWLGPGHALLPTMNSQELETHRFQCLAKTVSWPAHCQFILKKILPTPDAFVAVCNQGRYLFTWSFENLFN